MVHALQQEFPTDQKNAGGKVKREKDVQGRGKEGCARHIERGDRGEKTCETVANESCKGKKKKGTKRASSMREERKAGWGMEGIKLFWRWGPKEKKKNLKRS